MKVFKFGGASLATPQGYENVARIIRSFSGQKLVVASAMGKTTNALEAVVKAVDKGDHAMAKMLVRDLMRVHWETALVLDPTGGVRSTLADLEEGLLAHAQSQEAIDFDQRYDAIVPYGELLSTRILTGYMQATGGDVALLDAREMVLTTSEFRFASVDIETTACNVRQAVQQPTEVFITQGFIGRDGQGRSTTLGREGSDYTAALMAYSLEASEVTIWKDVDGIFSADPKKFTQAQLLPSLNYRLAAEMTFYGAQVIHPRTLQPLAGKGIELKVKSFLRPDGEGSVISSVTTEVRTPIIIQKEDLTLITCTANGIVFINDGAISQILGEASHIQARVYLMQHTALSFSLVIGSDINKAEQLQHRLSKSFHTAVNHNLTLLTLKNASEALEDTLLEGHEILLSQFSRRTHQYLLRPMNR